jgi:hypothetical protein
MNDLRENELLSAYLDGELTAAERTEVERLLAANPAARQLLDELRALRATLQALPPRKLGEDLSRQVLREAGRRMITEGTPVRSEPSSAAPLLAARSVLQRFVNRRTAVWLALTAAIAIMLTIHERRNRIQQADHGDRLVARAPAARDEKVVRGPLPPTSIQAAPDDLERNFGKAAAKLEKKIEPVPPAAATGELPSERSVGQMAVLNREAEKGQIGDGEPSAAKGSRSLGKRSGNLAEKSKKPKDESLLVVHCDISPEAARGEALDKLLDANGVIWYLDRGPSGRTRDADQDKAAAGEVLMYAEATPAQLKAVLAGLEAQPDVFLAVAIKPAHGQTPRDNYAYNRQRRAAAPRKSAAAGEKVGEKSEGKEKAASPVGGGMGGAAPESPAAGQPATAPADQPAAQQPQQAGPLADAQRQVQVQSTRQSVAKPSPRQQILFVVRVIGRDQQRAAKVQAKKDANAKAAEPAPRQRE